MISQLSLNLAGATLVTSALSYLGLGSQSTEHTSVAEWLSPSVPLTRDMFPKPDVVYGYAD